MLFDKLIPKELWERLATGTGPARWLGLAALVTLVVAIEWCETAAVKKVAHDAVTGCSESQRSMTERANQIFAALETRYGPPTRSLRNGDELVFEGARNADRAFPRFEVSLNDSSADACYWELLLSAHVTQAGPDAQKLVEALDGLELRRAYERQGFFVARDDGSVWLVKRESLRTTHQASFFWLEDHLDLAETWGREWIGEVQENLGKDAGGRREMKFRPGRDPKSVLDGVEAFLREAGVRD